MYYREDKAKCITEKIKQNKNDVDVNGHLT